MSVTFIDPPGPLTNKTEPIDFTTTKPVTSISIEFNPQLGNGARETVWDGTSEDGQSGGDFSYLYRNSTRTNGGLTWHIVRSSRWPAEMRIRIQEANPSGTSDPSIATLQPNLYSPLAQWSLRGAPAPGSSDYSVVRADRSGSGRHFTTGTAKRVPDMIPGQFAVNDLDLQLTDAVIGTLAGALTITLRAVIVQNDQSMFGIGGADGATNDLVVFSVNASGQLAYYSQHSTDSNTIWNSTIVPPKSQWVFLSLRRHVGGDVTVGLNDFYQNSGALTPPTNRGPTSKAGFALYTPSPSYFSGALADLCLWDKYLTDSELVPLYKAAMGIP